MRGAGILKRVACVTWIFIGLGAATLAQQPPAAAPPAPAKLRVGITLHPYYSWTRNVVAGTDVEVVPVLPGEVDAGSYQPRPEDVRKLAALDALVVNGIGHDDFVEAMVAAAGNAKLVWVKPNAETPLQKGHRGEAVNSHTFISFTNAIQQSYAIARELGRLRPALAAKFEANAADYAKRLRQIKADGAKALHAAAPEAPRRVVTVHDGYAYLMQEFGIEVAAVVEPAHGLVPSAAELKAVIDLIRREKVTAVFSEEGFPAPLVEVLRRDAGADLFVLSHVATGDYTDEKFEVEMKQNVAAIVSAFCPPKKAP